MGLKSFVQKRSLFLKIFFLLLLLSIATIIAVVIFINTLVVREQNKSIEQLQHRQLVYASTLMDLRVEEMEHNAISFLQNDDMISAMVNSQGSDADTKLRILSLLENQMTETESITNAFFYMPFSGLVYYANGDIVSLDYSPEQDLIQQYLTVYEEGGISLEDVQQKLMRRDGNLYLVTSYAVPNLIGVLFYEIDKDALCSLIQGDSQSEEVFIWDNDTETWIYNEPEESLLEEWSDGECEIYESSSLGWTYVCFPSLSGQQTGILYVAQTAIPFLIIYFLLSLWITLKITKNVYRPINRLLALSSSADQGKEKKRGELNETDYLEMMYSGTLTQNQNQKELLGGISDEIMRQMFQDLLLGTHAGDLQVKRTLDAMGRNDLLSSRYRILVVAFHKLEGDPPTPVEYSLYRRSLKHMAEAESVSGCEVWSLFLEEETACLIAAFAETEADTERKVAELERYLHESAVGLPYELRIQVNRQECGILMLGNSYREVREQIKQQSPPEPEDQSDRPDHVSLQEYYRVKSAQAVKIAEEQGWREAAERMDPIFRDLAGLDPLTQELARKALFASAADRLHQYGLSDETIEERTRDVSLLPERSDPTETAYVRLLVFLQNCNQSKKYRYIREAVSYISQHYQDGTLSLREVSDAIGISQTYFGELCSEIMRCGFSVYLSWFRVEKAKEFLRESDETAKAIGITCGFNSAQNFTRVFKKVTGMTPGQYRESVQRGEEGKI